MRVRLAERLLGIYTWLMIAFLALPVLIVIPVSFNSTGALAFPPHGFSLKWYRNIVAQPEFLRAFSVSAVVAVTATAIVLGLGSLAAYGLVRYRPPLARAVATLFLAPLSFPAIVYGVAMIMFFSRLRLTRSFTGLIIAHVVVVLPYVIRTVTATLYGLDRALEDAAMSLGANRWRTFRYVTLPLLKPGLIAGATFSLIMSWDEFTVSLFLVGGRVVTLPIAIYNYIEYIIDPTVAAISTVLILLSVAAIILIERFLGFEKHFQF